MRGCEIRKQNRPDLNSGERPRVAGFAINGVRTLISSESVLEACSLPGKKKFAATGDIIKIHSMLDRSLRQLDTREYALEVEGTVLMALYLEKSYGRVGMIASHHNTSASLELEGIKVGKVGDDQAVFEAGLKRYVVGGKVNSARLVCIDSTGQTLGLEFGASRLISIDLLGSRLEKVGQPSK